MARHDGSPRPLAGNVLGKLQQHGAGTFLLRDAERVPDHRRDAVALTIWRDIFVSGCIDATTSTIWKLRLPRRHDPLLSGQDHHRHRAEMRVGGARREVQRARPQCGNAHARLAGQSPVSRGHEGRCLFVPCDHEFDRRLAKRLDDVEVLLAGHAENPLDALVFQRGDEQIRPFVIVITSFHVVE